MSAGYPQDFNVYTKQDTQNRKDLTAMDGDPVGASVGLRGALEGEWLGLDDGDWLGLDVGCEVRMMRTNREARRVSVLCVYEMTAVKAIRDRLEYGTAKQHTYHTTKTTTEAAYLSRRARCWRY